MMKKHAKITHKGAKKHAAKLMRKHAHVLKKLSKKQRKQLKRVMVRNLKGKKH